MHLDHFVVLAEGKLADLTPPSPVAEDAELQLELVEVDRHDATAAVGKVDGVDVVVGGAAQLVGKRVKVRVERVLGGTAYASLTRKAKTVEPLTAEAEAEKPTRKPPARKESAEAGEVEESEELEETEETEPEDEDELEEGEIEDAEPTDGEPATTPAKKKTRRGSRGGRSRKKPAGAATPTGATTTTIHLPPDDLDGPDEAAAEPAQPVEVEADGAAPSENGDAPAVPVKKKTRRGSRGGKNRRKRTAAGAGAGASTGASAATSENGSEPAPETEPAPEAEREPEPEAAAQEEEWGYVPMAEWGDEFSG
jgi:hypothetical protein